MEKKSTISYKIYSNERLKPVLFHGKEIYPLYVQVIYERKPIYFKSYFFDLLSKEKYALDWIGGKKIPAQREIIQKEEGLLNFLIEKQGKQFSFDSFQSDYYHYGYDLLDVMDEGFKDYLNIFFLDEGQPELGILINTSRNKIMSAKLVDGFRSSLKHQLFKNLIGNAPAYGPPYLLFFHFAEKIIHNKIQTFSLFQWEIFQNDLQSFLKKEYPQYSYKNVEGYINSIIDR